MSRTKRQRLEARSPPFSANMDRALRKGSEMAAPPRPPTIRTSFAGLDAATGCQGIPLGHLSLFTGPWARAN
ncbi:MAG: hypothetical protein R2911_39165 [Caldilineaceae bacterium]